MFTDLMNDYKKTNANAMSGNWFVSPLEYFWPNGKEAFDKIFAIPAINNSNFDNLVAPVLFKNAMNIHFRSQMMVLGFMKQNISKSYGLEIENGLMHLYRLDFLSAISQWTYIIEGYSRKLFKVQSSQSSKYKDWTIPKVNDKNLDDLISCLADCLGGFFNSVLFASSNDRNLETINRHLLLHGNAENNNVFNQKNCLILMFCLDALLVIEMIQSRVFPMMFQSSDEDNGKISKREFLYGQILKSAFEDDNILKMEILKEHV